MSDNQVLGTIPFFCSRTQKHYDERMPVDEMMPFIEEMKKKTEVAKELGTTLTALPVKPDLVVYYKGKAVIMANVHGSNDVAIGRYINAIAKQNIFDLPEPKKRQAAADKAAPAPASDADTEIDITAEED